MKAVFYIIIATLVVLEGSAQTITNYTSLDGLIDNSVNAVDVDHNGNVWFGTQNGISMFDGQNWTSFSKTNGDGLIDDNVKTIAFDRNNNLWIGTDFGVSFYDGSTWTSYDDNNGLGDNRINHIYIDSNNKVWIGHNDGVSIFDGSWQQLDRNDGLPFGGVSHIDENLSGIIYFGTYLGGFFTYENEELTAYTEDEGLLNKNCTSIAFDEAGQIYVATIDGISLFSSDHVHIRNFTRVFELPAPDTLNPITDIEIDSRGKVWAGVYVDYLVTVGGVSSLSQDGWSDLDESNGLIGPVVNDLAIDANDGIWVATSTGVSLITEFRTSTYDNDFEQLTIHPNPARDYIVINLPSLETNSAGPINIYDMSGSLIQTLPFYEGREQKISLNLRTKGHYFVQFGQHSAKFMVQ